MITQFIIPNMKPSLNLLLLASNHSYRVDMFNQAANLLGVPVVLGLDVPPPMLGKVGTQLALDYQDIPRSVRRIEQFHQSQPIGALIGLDDSGTLIAAAASQAVGLAYNAPEAARATRDKYTMRQHFAQAGVSSPGFARYHLTDDPEQIAVSTRYPCVLKPTTMAGSRGVMRADTPDEFRQRWTRLRAMLLKERCDEFLVEDYIPGVEVALEGLMDGGKLHVLALFDKPDPLEGPFFEETIYVTPSRLPKTVQREIVRVAEQAAQALGLHMGPVHAELRWNEADGAMMVELASRTIGGLCSKTLAFGSNIPLEALIIQQAMGMPLTLDRDPRAGGVMMIPIPDAGILTRVDGVADASATPLVESVEITAPLHQPLVPLPEGNSYLGFIFARGDTPAAVENALRLAHSKLYFEIMPSFMLPV